MGRRPKNYVPPHPLALIECVRCGENKPESEFYCNKQSRIYNVKKRVPLCKDCVQVLLEEYSQRYGEETAVFSLCGIMDLPFLHERYKKIAETNPPFSFWKYIKQLQINQYRDISFADSLSGEDLSRLKQANPAVYTTNERLNRLQEGFSSLREELHRLRSEITADSTKKKTSKTRKTALYRAK